MINFHWGIWLFLSFNNYLLNRFFAVIWVNKFGNSKSFCCTNKIIITHWKIHGASYHRTPDRKKRRQIPFSPFSGLLSTPIIVDAPLSLAPCATYYTRNHYSYIMLRCQLLFFLKKNIPMTLLKLLTSLCTYRKAYGSKTKYHHTWSNRYISNIPSCTQAYNYIHIC